MDTTPGHSWSITAIDSTAIYRRGTAATSVKAWTAALAAGRTALLAGDLDTLAISIDGQLEALYDPDPAAGPLDPVEITADLVEIRQSVTAGALADELVAG